jgi:SAM-dependent methyltransferase
MGKINDKEFLKVAEFAKRKIKEITGSDFSYDFDSRLYRQGIIEDLEMISKLTVDKRKALDFGCGRGIFSIMLAGIFKEVEGIDIMPDKNRDCEPSGPLQNRAHQKEIWNAFDRRFGVKLDYYKAGKIPFDDREFGLIVGYAVLEHIPANQLPEILEEIYRVLKPNGVFYIARTPRRFSYAEKLAGFAGLGHEKLFSEKELISGLRKAGFKMEELDRTDFVPAFSIFKKIGDTNLGFKILNLADKIFLATPLKYFSHHLRIICRK